LREKAFLGHKECSTCKHL